MTDNTQAERDVIIAAMIAQKHFNIDEAEAYLTAYTNQASEDVLELIVARISAGIGGFGRLTRGTRYVGISEEAGIELLKAYIRHEKLELLAEVKEQIKAGGYEASYEISVVDKLEAEL